MKQILILRHAKSSWEDESLDDYDRPLASRGINDAPMMGKFIRKIKHKPGSIISSSAKRAKETTLYAVESMKVDESIISWNRDLYYGSESSYLESIQNSDDSFERIMLVGHNPKVENVAGGLIGSGGVASLRMPTAALVCIQSYAQRWEQINWGNCQLSWMVIPKALKKVFS